jgi:hypothetical protein
MVSVQWADGVIRRGGLRGPLDRGLEQLVDECLVGLPLPGGQLPEFGQEVRIQANRNELLGPAGGRPAHATGGPQFRVGRFRDVAEIDAAIRRMPGVPCGRLGAR